MKVTVANDRYDPWMPSSSSTRTFDPARVLRQAIVIEFATSLGCSILAASIFVRRLFANFDTLSVGQMYVYFLGAPIIVGLVGLIAWWVIHRAQLAKVRQARDELHAMMLAAQWQIGGDHDWLTPDMPRRRIGRMERGAQVESPREAEHEVLVLACR
jgi:hypothetical protein